METHTTLAPSTTQRTHQGWLPPQPAPRRQNSQTSWAVWTATTVASIWTAVALISVLSPDMVSGSEQQRMPVAAFSTWLWGAGATIAFLVPLVRMRRDPGRRLAWIALSGITIVAWTVAMLVSIFAPPMVTGTDPTTIPLAALISPVAATVATTLAAAVTLFASALSPTPARPLSTRTVGSAV